MKKTQTPVGKQNSMQVIAGQYTMKVEAIKFDVERDQERVTLSVVSADNDTAKGSIHMWNLSAKQSEKAIDYLNTSWARVNRQLGFTDNNNKPVKGHEADALNTEKWIGHELKILVVANPTPKFPNQVQTVVIKPQGLVEEIA